MRTALAAEESNGNENQQKAEGGPGRGRPRAAPERGLERAGGGRGAAAPRSDPPSGSRAVYGAGEAGCFAGFGEERRRRKWSPRSRAGYERGREKARALVEAGAYGEIRSPELLVGLFAVLHEKVYGVEADDLADAWKAAVAAARRLVESFGGGDDGERRAFEFVRWTWQREKAREDWARKQGQVRRRATWRLQFASSALLVDYRREVVAKAASSRTR